MIKVIKRGKVPRGQITCPNCHSVLEYGNADLHVDWDRKKNYCNNYLCDPMCLMCPECGVEIAASRVSLPKDEIPQ